MKKRKENEKRLTKNMRGRERRPSRLEIDSQGEYGVSQDATRLGKQTQKQNIRTSTNAEKARHNTISHISPFPKANRLPKHQPTDVNHGHLFLKRPTDITVLFACRSSPAPLWFIWRFYCVHNLIICVQVRTYRMLCSVMPRNVHAVSKYSR